MSNNDPLPAALAIDALPGDARAAFDTASSSHYHAISFATNHHELAPAHLGQSARRHLKTLLAAKHLSIDSLRVAAPKAGLTENDTIDRTLDNARKAFLLAADLGIKTVALNLGNLSTSKVPESSLVAAVRDLAQYADSANLILALSSEGTQNLRALIKDVDYERAHVNFDTARLIAAAEDPIKIAEEFAGIIAQVTAADAILAGTFRATFLGEGQLPLPELLAILAEQGFHGPLIVDPRDLPDPAAAARHAALALQKLLTGS